MGRKTVLKVGMLIRYGDGVYINSFLKDLLVLKLCRNVWYT